VLSASTRSLGFLYHLEALDGPLFLVYVGLMMMWFAVHATGDKEDDCIEKDYGFAVCSAGSWRRALIVSSTNGILRLCLNFF